MSQWIAVALAIASAVCLSVGTQTQSAAVRGETSGALRPRNLGPCCATAAGCSARACWGWGWR